MTIQDLSTVERSDDWAYTTVAQYLNQAIATIRDSPSESDGGLDSRNPDTASITSQLTEHAKASRSFILDSIQKTTATLAKDYALDTATVDYLQQSLTQMMATTTVTLTAESEITLDYSIRQASKRLLIARNATTVPPARTQLYPDQDPLPLPAGMTIRPQPDAYYDALNIIHYWRQIHTPDWIHMADSLIYYCESDYKHSIGVMMGLTATDQAITGIYLPDPEGIPQLITADAHAPVPASRYKPVLLRYADDVVVAKDSVPGLSQMPLADGTRMQPQAVLANTARMGQLIAATQPNDADPTLFLDPDDPDVSALIQTLKNQGLLTSGMSETAIATLIHATVRARITYTPDETDSWQPSAATLARGAGDCEDMAILTASLLMHALADMGHTDAAQTVRLEAGLINNQTGHMLVRLGDYAIDATQDHALIQRDTLSMTSVYDISTTGVRQTGRLSDVARLNRVGTATDWGAILANNDFTPKFITGYTGFVNQTLFNDFFVNIARGLDAPAVTDYDGEIPEYYGIRIADWGNNTLGELAKVSSGYVNSNRQTQLRDSLHPDDTINTDESLDVYLDSTTTAAALLDKLQTFGYFQHYRTGYTNSSNYADTNLNNAFLSHVDQVFGSADARKTGIRTLQHFSDGDDDNRAYIRNELRVLTQVEIDAIMRAYNNTDATTATVFTQRTAVMKAVLQDSLLASTLFGGASGTTNSALDAYSVYEKLVSYENIETGLSTLSGLSATQKNAIRALFTAAANTDNYDFSGTTSSGIATAINAMPAEVTSRVLHDKLIAFLGDRYRVPITEKTSLDAMLADVDSIYRTIDPSRSPLLRDAASRYLNGVMLYHLAISDFSGFEPYDIAYKLVNKSDFYDDAGTLDTDAFLDFLRPFDLEFYNRMRTDLTTLRKNTALYTSLKHAGFSISYRLFSIETETRPMQPVWYGDFNSFQSVLYTLLAPNTPRPPLDYTDPLETQVLKLAATLCKTWPATQVERLLDIAFETVNTTPSDAVTAYTNSLTDTSTPGVLAYFLNALRNKPADEAYYGTLWAIQSASASIDKPARIAMLEHLYASRVALKAALAIPDIADRMTAVATAIHLVDIDLKITLLGLASVDTYTAPTDDLLAIQAYHETVLYVINAWFQDGEPVPSDDVINQIKVQLKSLFIHSDDTQTDQLPDGTRFSDLIMIFMQSKSQAYQLAAIPELATYRNRDYFTPDDINLLAFDFSSHHDLRVADLYTRLADATFLAYPKLTLAQINTHESLGLTATDLQAFAFIAQDGNRYYLKPDVRARDADQTTWSDAAQRVYGLLQEKPVVDPAQTPAFVTALLHTYTTLDIALNSIRVDPMDRLRALADRYSTLSVQPLIIAYYEPLDTGAYAMAFKLITIADLNEEINAGMLRRDDLSPTQYDSYTAYLRTLLDLKNQYTSVGDSLISAVPTLEALTALQADVASLAQAITSMQASVRSTLIGITDRLTLGEHVLNLSVFDNLDNATTWSEPEFDELRRFIVQLAQSNTTPQTEPMATLMTAGVFSEAGLIALVDKHPFILNSTIDATLIAQGTPASEPIIQAVIGAIGRAEPSLLDTTGQIPRVVGTGIDLDTMTLSWQSDTGGTHTLTLDTFIETLVADNTIGDADQATARTVLVAVATAMHAQQAMTSSEAEQILAILEATTILDSNHNTTQAYATATGDAVAAYHRSLAAALETAEIAAARAAHITSLVEKSQAHFGIALNHASRERIINAITYKKQLAGAYDQGKIIDYYTAFADAFSAVFYDTGGHDLETAIASGNAGLGVLVAYILGTISLAWGVLPGHKISNTIVWDGPTLDSIVGNSIDLDPVVSRSALLLNTIRLQQLQQSLFQKVDSITQLSRQLSDELTHLTAQKKIIEAYIYFHAADVDGWADALLAAYDQDTTTLEQDRVLTLALNWKTAASDGYDNRPDWMKKTLDYDPVADDHADTEINSWDDFLTALKHNKLAWGLQLPDDFVIQESSSSASESSRNSTATNLYKWAVSQGSLDYYSIGSFSTINAALARTIVTEEMAIERMQANLPSVVMSQLGETTDQLRLSMMVQQEKNTQTNETRESFSLTGISELIRQLSQIKHVLQLLHYSIARDSNIIYLFLAVLYGSKGSASAAADPYSEFSPADLLSLSFENRLSVVQNTLDSSKTVATALMSHESNRSLSDSLTPSSPMDDYYATLKAAYETGIQQMARITEELDLLGLADRETHNASGTAIAMGTTADSINRVYQSIESDYETMIAYERSQELSDYLLASSTAVDLLANPFYDDVTDFFICFRDYSNGLNSDIVGNAPGESDYGNIDYTHGTMVNDYDARQSINAALAAEHSITQDDASIFYSPIQYKERIDDLRSDLGLDIGEVYKYSFSKTNRINLDAETMNPDDLDQGQATVDRLYTYSSRIKAIRQEIETELITNNRVDQATIQARKTELEAMRDSIGQIEFPSTLENYETAINTALQGVITGIGPLASPPAGALERHLIIGSPEDAIARMNDINQNNVKWENSRAEFTRRPFFDINEAKLLGVRDALTTLGEVMQLLSLLLDIKSDRINRTMSGLYGSKMGGDSVGLSDMLADNQAAIEAGLGAIETAIATLKDYSNQYTENYVQEVTAALDELWLELDLAITSSTAVIAAAIEAAGAAAFGPFGAAVSQAVALAVETAAGIAQAEVKRAAKENLINSISYPESDRLDALDMRDFARAGTDDAVTGKILETLSDAQDKNRLFLGYDDGLRSLDATYVHHLKQKLATAEKARHLRLNLQLRSNEISDRVLQVMYDVAPDRYRAKLNQLILKRGNFITTVFDAIQRDMNDELDRQNKEFERKQTLEEIRKEFLFDLSMVALGVTLAALPAMASAAVKRSKMLQRMATATSKMAKAALSSAKSTAKTVLKKLPKLGIKAGAKSMSDTIMAAMRAARESLMTRTNLAANAVLKAVPDLGIQTSIKTAIKTAIKIGSRPLMQIGGKLGKLGRRLSELVSKIASVLKKVPAYLSEIVAKRAAKKAAKDLIQAPLRAVPKRLNRLVKVKAFMNNLINRFTRNQIRLKITKSFVPNSIAIDKETNQYSDAKQSINLKTSRAVAQQALIVSQDTVQALKTLLASTDNTALRGILSAMLAQALVSKFQAQLAVEMATESVEAMPWMTQSNASFGTHAYSFNGSLLSKLLSETTTKLASLQLTQSVSFTTGRLADASIKTLYGGVPTQPATYSNFHDLDMAVLKTMMTTTRQYMRSRADLQTKLEAMKQAKAEATVQLVASVAVLAASFITTPTTTAFLFSTIQTGVGIALKTTAAKQATNSISKNNLNTSVTSQVSATQRMQPRSTTAAPVMTAVNAVTQATQATVTPAFQTLATVSTPAAVATLSPAQAVAFITAVQANPSQVSRLSPDQQVQLAQALAVASKTAVASPLLSQHQKITLTTQVATTIQAISDRATTPAQTLAVALAVPATITAAQAQVQVQRLTTLVSPTMIATPSQTTALVSALTTLSQASPQGSPQTATQVATLVTSLLATLNPTQIASLSVRDSVALVTALGASAAPSDHALMNQLVTHVASHTLTAAEQVAVLQAIAAAGVPAESVAAILNQNTALSVQQTIALVTALSQISQTLPMTATMMRAVSDHVAAVIPKVTQEQALALALAMTQINTTDGVAVPRVLLEALLLDLPDASRLIMLLDTSSSLNTALHAIQSTQSKMPSASRVESELTQNILLEQDGKYVLNDAAVAAIDRKLDRVQQVQMQMAAALERMQDIIHKVLAVLFGAVYERNSIVSLITQTHQVAANDMHQATVQSMRDWIIRENAIRDLDAAMQASITSGVASLLISVAGTKYQSAGLLDNTPLTNASLHTLVAKRGSKSLENIGQVFGFNTPHVRDNTAGYSAIERQESARLNTVLRQSTGLIGLLEALKLSKVATDYDTARQTTETAQQSVISEDNQHMLDYMNSLVDAKAMITRLKKQSDAYWTRIGNANRVAIKKTMIMADKALANSHNITDDSAQEAQVDDLIRLLHRHHIIDNSGTVITHMSPITEYMTPRVYSHNNRLIKDGQPVAASLSAYQLAIMSRLLRTRKNRVTGYIPHPSLSGSISELGKHTVQLLTLGLIQPDLSNKVTATYRKKIQDIIQANITARGALTLSEWCDLRSKYGLEWPAIAAGISFLKEDYRPRFKAIDFMTVIQDARDKNVYTIDKNGKKEQKTRFPMLFNESYAGMDTSVPRMMRNQDAKGLKKGLTGYRDGFHDVVYSELFQKPDSDGFTGWGRLLTTYTSADGIPLIDDDGICHLDRLVLNYTPKPGQAKPTTRDEIEALILQDVFATNLALLTDDRYAAGKTWFLAQVGVYLNNLQQADNSLCTDNNDSELITDDINDSEPIETIFDDDIDDIEDLAKSVVDVALGDLV